jgi:phosphatidate cytidylyltransferase
MTILLIVSGLVIIILRRLKILSEEQYGDTWGRWTSWAWLIPFITVPILAGAAWTMGAVALLSLACYREYARATGLFRVKSISIIIVLGILLITFANIDHYERLFFAAASLTVSMIAIVSIPFDQPKGYVQRTALGIFGFLLFGFSLGYLGNISNDGLYRPILILIFLSVELNDIFAYCVGRTLGGPKLLVNTSPGKTIAGALGALILTTVFVAVSAHFIFYRTAIDTIPVLITLGIMISSLGQLGDLVLSSIKRDIGIKDIGTAIPGHGGLLDRFDSMVLVPPAVYHFLSYFLGPLGGLEQIRILTGG